MNDDIRDDGRSSADRRELRPQGIDRRAFLGAVAAVPALGALPLRWLPGGDDSAIVVLELVGGNDWLNTLIPIDDSKWSAARPTLSAVANGAHRLRDTGFALHPAMQSLVEPFDRGEWAAMLGVGYLPPDRSHFHSRDVWHTADPGLSRARPATTGWLGRAADVLAARGAAVPAIAVGGVGVPLALRGEQVVVPALQRLDDYVLRVDPAAGPAGRESLRALIDDEAGAAASGGDLARYVAEVSRAALADEARLREALADYRPRAEYPAGPFGEALQLAAQVIVSGFGTRIVHLTFGGFDTHANQAPTQATLLGVLARGLAALLRDLREQHALDRTTILVHSEFGRRVAENQSQGTDHGAAGPVLVCGGGVRPGIHGAPLDLDHLLDGDLQVTADFRTVYADLLGWLGVDHEAVLGGRFTPAGLLRS